MNSRNNNISYKLLSHLQPSARYHTVIYNMYTSLHATESYDTAGFLFLLFPRPWPFCMLSQNSTTKLHSSQNISNPFPPKTRKLSISSTLPNVVREPQNSWFYKTAFSEKSFYHPLTSALYNWRVIKVEQKVFHHTKYPRNQIMNEKVYV